MEGLDIHCQMILEEYRSALPKYEQARKEVERMLRDALDQNGLVVTGVETRIKTEESLSGKLALKGQKYQSLSDITDILGARVVTFYTDDVDRIASIAEKLFDIDWENSIDKRRLHQLDTFGYNSLHYICRYNGIRFELQLRTTLQHAWASINHDTGYKSGVEVPREYLRRINRLAGILELADDEFSRIRTELNEYRRRMNQLVKNGTLDEVPLDGDTFKSYLEIHPFDKLNKSIAAINQAEIQEVPLIRYLRVIHQIGCKTLGDVNRLIEANQEEAFQLARHQLGSTDLDILSSAVGIQNICIVAILKQGGGKPGLATLFTIINGDNPLSETLAELTYKQASNLPFMQQKP